MALSANTVWEVRTTGNNTNGGGFVTGASGTDWSQQDAAQYSVTDAVTNGTTTITSATANFGTDVVGNLLYIAGGTGAITGDWYQITARTNSTTITVDRSTGLTTGTGATLKIGGALADLSVFTSTSAQANGQTIYIKDGTYSHTTQIVVQLVTTLIGYSVTRTDNVARPIIRTTNTDALIGFMGSAPYNFIAKNIDFDGNSVTGTTTIEYHSAVNALTVQMFNCIVRRMAGVGVGTGSNGISEYAFCYIHSNGSHGIGVAQHSVRCYGCFVVNNGGHGVGEDSSGGNVTLINSIVADNGGDGIAAYGQVIVNSIIANNTGDGLGVWTPAAVIQALYLHNTIIYGNGGYGVITATLSGAFQHSYVAIGGNTSGNYQNLANPANGHIALSADPFIDSANYNFALNNTAGGGALCRNTGFPGTFPGGLTTGYMDIGAAQTITERFIQFFGVRT